MDLLVSNSRNALFISQLNVLNDAMSRAQQELASGKSVAQRFRRSWKRSRDRAKPGRPGAGGTKPVQPQHVELGSWYGEQQPRECREHHGQDQLARPPREPPPQTDAQTRQMLAGQIQDLETQIVGIANSTNEGRYLFGGDDDSTAPYSINYANAPPFTANTTAQATRMGIDAMGNTFPIAVTASDIFNNAESTQNILQSIENLRQGLLNNKQPGDCNCRHSAFHGGPAFEQCAGFLWKRGEHDHHRSQHCIHDAIKPANAAIAVD